MLRAGLLALFGVLGSIAAFILSVVIGISAGSWIAFFVALAVTSVLVYVIYKMIWNAGRINMDSWLSSVGNCKHKYAWDGSGIAIDPSTKTIHVASKFGRERATKSYPLSAVRGWEYNIKGAVVHQANQVLVAGGGLGTHLQAASHNVGASVGAGIATIASDVMAKEQTGLTIKMADIDHPVWFIKFRPEKELQMTLSRWMEIIQQSVNE